MRFSEGLDKDISIRLQNVLNDIWSKVVTNGNYRCVHNYKLNK